MSNTSICSPRPFSHVYASTGKSKITVNSTNHTSTDIPVKGEKLEEVTSFLTCEKPYPRMVQLP
ncbi:hypothetical protein DPMN_070752 [Dreissena polymorpha]|uniref:Uncharacterized protein n=1 Tax=Dreissena polymorpha TaxID=45954 RepID=A0A9D3Z613_DREPO|nr:hypothetical protein DPMN_070752 [Dreissena polymorpha]